ncbi:glycoside hydrolase family 32 protein [Eisenbergiella massiliensis]|uniref:Sucrose-6-phosphate hydrolase n=1 Tax=Eisenbergiella massiliensis TaxID=1720294 RepID=A0A3E3I7M3_9FIRM|nr:glycoside hydrolase family 32 protein [Eisenbergiella massiliensis]RGE62447.1 glycoside hydrolase family 32 protein [Eisenbergiella massiliensis]
MSEALEKAREWEKMHCRTAVEKPFFHVCAPTGWINDPNGFSQYKGEYHLFYQYHPYNKHWGPMHWGHSKTDDFIKWLQMPCAMAPDEAFDGQGCFSGSAVEFQGKHVLMYTGVTQKEKDGKIVINQNQCIAFGDGKDYIKYPYNPVITAQQMPQGSSKEDFRDPKIWKDNDKFYTIIGSRGEDGSGQLGLFESEDIVNWKFVTILERCENRYGKMWECPDFFEIGDTAVIIVSPQEMQAEGLEFHNGGGTLALVGNYNKKEHLFQRKKVTAVDYGLDFYAPQTLKSEDGRRIMIGWMQNWDTYLVPENMTWSGIMTIPRQLEIRDGSLYQNPVRELENYYSNEVKIGKVRLEGERSFEGINGRSIDLTVEIYEDGKSEFSIRFASNEYFYSEIIYSPEKEILTFDRTYSGLVKDVISRRSMKVKKREGRIKVRLLLDRYTVEIFVNDGEQAMSSLIYTSLDAEKIMFYGDGSVISILKYDVVL